jgi:hypothetical protein
MTGAVALAVLGLVGCEEDDAVFGPHDDDVPPTVSITNISQGADTLRISVTAEDFISIAFIVTELRRTDAFETVVTAGGDTLILGRLLAVDTARFTGRATTATSNTTFFGGFAQATVINVRAVAVDAQGNQGVDDTNVLVGGGGTGGGGGGLGGPQVEIYSPLAGSTVRDNTLIRVGVRAADPTGLQQLNVVLTGLAPNNPDPAADTIRFAEFRTDVDTLLDFFIPQGASGALTITAEAINLNTISGFAQITVTVAQEVSGDTVPPTVSMLVSGGVQRRTNEPPRMEIDDSLRFNLVATDNETALTRIGMTIVVLNQRDGGAVTETITLDSILDPAVSGSVPHTFTITPGTLPASLFSEADIPDTLFFDLTAWAIDAASNCGATVDPLGSPNRLACTSTTPPIQASGLQGGRVERLIVAGRTVTFPQGSLIADAVVDTLRELLILSDFNFGALRPFDLRNEVFVRNVPVGSQPWGLSISLSEDEVVVSNSGGTNISVIDLGPRTPGAIAIAGEVDRFQTQDLKVFRVREDFEPTGGRIFPVQFFDYSDRPQFNAEAQNGSILYSTVPALDNLPGTIREFNPVDREVRFFVSYASRRAASQPEIQIVNADSVFELNGARQFIVCDHTRGVAAPAGRSCIIADSLPDASAKVATKIATEGWDVDIFSDLDIASIGLQDTTFVVSSGDHEFIAFGEGDTPDRAGRIIMYESDTRSITNTLQVSDLTGNAEQRVFGLALNNDGSLGVARGEKAYFFGPDQPGNNSLRLLGFNDNINPEGVGAALHPSHDVNSTNVESERLAFLGSGDARVEMVDTHFFSFSRGQVLIRDPIVGPLRVTRRLPNDPAGVLLKLYGVTANGVVVIPVKDTDIIAIP